jgi:hypothetical protein
LLPPSLRDRRHAFPPSLLREQQPSVSDDILYVSVCRCSRLFSHLDYMCQNDVIHLTFDLKRRDRSSGSTSTQHRLITTEPRIKHCITRSYCTTLIKLQKQRAGRPEVGCSLFSTKPAETSRCLPPLPALVVVQISTIESCRPIVLASLQLHVSLEAFAFPPASLGAGRFHTVFRLQTLHPPPALAAY